MAVINSDELSGSNSVVESRLPKPLVAGSIPVSRSKSSCQWLVVSCQIQGRRSFDSNSLRSG